MSEDDTSIRTKQSLSVGAEGAKAEHETEVKGVASIIKTWTKYRNPKQFRDAEIQAATAETITRKLLNDEPLNEVEKILYLMANEEGIRKAANLRATLEKAADMSPQISAVLEGKELPQLPAPRESDADQGGDEKTRQFFYDRWKTYAEINNDKGARDFLAAILAGEVKAAGSFSIKTLDVLMNLENDDALAFQELAKYMVVSDDDVEAAVPMLDDKWFTVLLRLSEADLVSATPSEWSFSNVAEDLPRYFLHAGLVIRPLKRVFHFEARAITRAGRQIASLFGKHGVQHELMQFLLKRGSFETSTSPDGPFLAWGEESPQDP